MIDNILKLASKRITVLESGEKPEFYKGSDTFVSSLHAELAEALAELREDNTIRLEDELGDIFWVYINLLESLAADGKITDAQSVFTRCYKKYSQRLDPTTGKNAGDWIEIKTKQKEEIMKEHNDKYKQ